PREFLGLADEPGFLAIELLEERRLHACQALTLGEINQALEIDLADTDFAREPHERRQLRDGLLEARQPERDPRLPAVRCRLHGGKGANVAHDSVEHVAATYEREGPRLGRVERDAELVQPRIDELPALAAREQRPVRVEQHVSAAILQ